MGWCDDCQSYWEWSIRWEWTNKGYEITQANLYSGSHGWNNSRILFLNHFISHLLVLISMAYQANTYNAVPFAHVWYTVSFAHMLIQWRTICTHADTMLYHLHTCLYAVPFAHMLIQWHIILLIRSTICTHADTLAYHLLDTQYHLHACWYNGVLFAHYADTLGCFFRFYTPPIGQWQHVQFKVRITVERFRWSSG